MWPLLALGSALAFCFVSVCDKRLLSFHLNGVPPLCLWCGATGLIYGAIVAAIVGLPADTGWQVALIPVVAGLFMGCSVVLLFRGLRLMEASRAVAISQIQSDFRRHSGSDVPGRARFAGAMARHRAGGRRSGADLGAPVPGAAPSDASALGVAVPSTAVFDLRDRTAVYGPALLVISAMCAASSFVVAKAALNAELPVLTVFGIQQATVAQCSAAPG